MRSLLRPASLFITATYLLLSAVPLVPLLLGHPVDAPGRILCIEFLGWLIAWSLMASPARFHWLLFPAFLALPAELYLNAYYNQNISAHHLGIVMETSPTEAREFIGGKWWLAAGAVLGMTAWWLGSWCAARSCQVLEWRSWSRWIAVSIVATMLAVWWYAQESEAGKPRASATARSVEQTPSAIRTASWRLLPLPDWARPPFSREDFSRSWPFGIFLRAYDFWKERQYLSSLSQKSELFRFGARQVGKDSLAQTIVIVIGESSRYDRWSLNGYERETNPLLEKETNIVTLSNVITAVSATRLSVPIVLSRKPALQSLQAGFAEKSFLSAFKEAGFKTWWLSNQMSFGQFDTPVSVFAKEADITRFVNVAGFSSNASFDDALLLPLAAAMSDRAEKKLIVLHTLGNHWNYSQRYPKEYDKWQPSLFGVANPAYTDRKIKQQLNNSYDNSILYTDWFLSQVIKALKSESQMTTMMYVADHGQTLYDGNCSLAFHGHNTQFEFHVPALLWYSDLYRAAHPKKINYLLRNRHAPLTTENVFHTLLDLADIRYDGEHLDRSFVSSHFRPHKRYVDSYGWTDYDNAIFKGDCREVIDKGTPLPRD